MATDNKYQDPTQLKKDQPKAALYEEATPLAQGQPGTPNYEEATPLAQDQPETPNYEEATPLAQGQPGTPNYEEATPLAQDQPETPNYEEATPLAQDKPTSNYEEPTPKSDQGTRPLPKKLSKYKPKPLSEEDEINGVTSNPNDEGAFDVLISTEKYKALNSGEELPKTFSELNTVLKRQGKDGIPKLASAEQKAKALKDKDQAENPKENPSLSEENTLRKGLSG